MNACGTLGMGVKRSARVASTVMCTGWMRSTNEFPILRRKTKPSICLYENERTGLISVLPGHSFGRASPPTSCWISVTSGVSRLGG